MSLYIKRKSQLSYLFIVFYLFSGGNQLPDFLDCVYKKGKSFEVFRSIKCLNLFLQTCLELERYLQTEPKRLSDLFDEELDGLLTPSFMKEDGDEDLLDPLLPSLNNPPSPPPPPHLTPRKETVSSASSTVTSPDITLGVNAAQLNAVTSLTPPSSPELGRHLVKPTHTLSASPDGTLTLKLVARKVGLSSAKLVAAHPVPLSPQHGSSGAQSDGEQGGTFAMGTGEMAENKKRVHRCQFNGCRKVYTKSSHLKAHQRTHTGKRVYLL